MYNGKQRKPNRKRGHNYCAPGYYFVTLRTKDGGEWFGCVNDGRMLFNKLGGTAHILWQVTSVFFPNVRFDSFVVMPNHIHAIIQITASPPSVWAESHSAHTDPVGCAFPSGHVRNTTDTTTISTDITKSGKHYGTISKIIKSFKHEFTKTIRCLYGNYQFRWKRSFHDRIIRNERELNIKRNYVRNNPTKWWRNRNNKAQLVRVESHSTLTNPVGVLPPLPTCTLPPLPTRTLPPLPTPITRP